MQIPEEVKIKQLFEQHNEAGELLVEYNDEVLRIDLIEDDMRLWVETLSRYKSPYNLLLACENDNCELKDTQLTWVVGSAIRPFLSTSLEEAKILLISLGVKPSIASIAEKHCPGLGTKVPWAFYRQRDGRVTASPIIDTK